MAAVTIDSVDVHVAPDGHAADDRDLGEATRSAGGYLRSNTTATKGRERVMRLETRPMPSALASTVENALDTAGRVTADGYLVDGGPLSAYVLALERTPNPDAPSLTSFRFELHFVATI